MDQVTWNASGPAVSKAVSCAEIMKRKIKVRETTSLGQKHADLVLRSSHASCERTRAVVCDSPRIPLVRGKRYSERVFMHFRAFIRTQKSTSKGQCLVARLQLCGTNLDRHRCDSENLVFFVCLQFDTRVLHLSEKRLTGSPRCRDSTGEKGI